MLSKEQERAAYAIDGQVLVVACPGSGKTTTIIQRALNMVNRGIDPNSMINITFTKAAAEEMAKRFEKLSGGIKMPFSTIHAFCYRQLCSEYGYTQDDIIKESEKWIYILDHLKGKAAPAQVEDMVKEAMEGISFVKNKELSAKAFQTEKIDKQSFLDIFKGYEAYKEKLHKIDFDDMLIVFRDKLVSDKAFLEKLWKKYKYVTVDEFQDVNKIQADICYMIAGPEGNIFIVGDDDQSIYRFRAAESKIMLDFEKTYPKCIRIDLDTNYRSCESIITIADNLIQNNKTRFPKDFKAFRKEEGIIYTLKSETGFDQAKKIVREIKDAVSKKKLEYNDIAILFRTNNLSLPLAAIFIKENIPFYMTERVASIHQDPIFSDIKAYYQIASGQERRGDLQKILNKPSRYLPADAFLDINFDEVKLLKAADNANLKPFAREKLKDMCWDIRALKDRKNPKEFLNYLMGPMEYRSGLKKTAEYLNKDVNEYYEVLDELIAEASEFKTMKEWFEYIETYEVRLKEASKKKKEGVCLSTFHGSKGLEWKCVFVININEKVTPYVKAVTEEELEEERRMFYVAITRAKDILYLSYLSSMQKESIPSRYFEEMGIEADEPFAGEKDLKLDENKGLGV
jgi:DNA helicase-2/ATP-dependent DNA helicase PcrA